jgi:exonuclease III
MKEIIDAPNYVYTALSILKEDLDTHIPAKKVDRNILIATWNIRAFGDFTPKWNSDKGDSPKRDIQSIIFIAEIISRFDVVAVQEVKANIRALKEVMKYLGNHWSFILTDITKGASGNGERIAYLFDTRRVQLSGLASELVVPKEELNKIGENALTDQFARTPYAVSFKIDHKSFILVTLHILYGKKKADRIPELKAIADWLADWGKDSNVYDKNLIALGDFNIDKRGDLLHDTFISSGLYIPTDMQMVTRSIFDETKYYDHIAWFMGHNNTPKLSLEYLRGGNYNFVGKTLYSEELTKLELSWRISDHYPLWAEFSTRNL